MNLQPLRSDTSLQQLNLLLLHFLIGQRSGRASLVSALHVWRQFHLGSDVHVVTPHVELERHRLVDINLTDTKREWSCIVVSICILTIFSYMKTFYKILGI